MLKVFRDLEGIFPASLCRTQNPFQMYVSHAEKFRPRWTHTCRKYTRHYSAYLYDLRFANVGQSAAEPHNTSLFLSLPAQRAKRKKRTCIRKGALHFHPHLQRVHAAGHEAITQSFPRCTRREWKTRAFSMWQQIEKGLSSIVVPTRGNRQTIERERRKQREELATLAWCNPDMS